MTVHSKSDVEEHTRVAAYAIALGVTLPSI